MIKTYLSLFSGIGGGDLALQHIIGLKCLGYVEYEKYCQKIIQQRIENGFLDAAPIFGEIRKFVNEGYADTYQKMVDVVAGGFPCQPFSTAGKRKGAEDERNMWPATCEIIKRIKPCYAFLENVPGLTYSGYLGRILQDLAQIGYDGKWMHLSAADCGALHKRERLWIMANIGDNWISGREWRIQKAETDRTGVVTNPKVEYDRKHYTKSYKRQVQQFRKGGRKANLSKQKNKQTDWWIIEPTMDRVANGIPNRMVQLRGLGNAQVPIVAATAFKILFES